MLPSTSDLAPSEPNGSVVKKPASASRVLPEPLLDSDEAASIMKIHPKTLQKLARKGIVRGVHIGKLWRFRLSEIERWIDHQMAS
jgi:excisionase family DNA binding protein